MYIVVLVCTAFHRVGPTVFMVYIFTFIVLGVICRLGYHFLSICRFSSVLLISVREAVVVVSDQVFLDADEVV